MKSMVRLFETLLLECSEMAGINAERDLFTARKRLAREGDSFLTITLPQFEKDLTSALDMGMIHPTHFYRLKSEKGGKRPRFLGALMAVLFSQDGYLRTDNVEEHGEAVKLLRQITLFFSKIENPTTPERVQAALDQYVSTDNDVPELDPFDFLTSKLNETVWELFGPMLSEVEKRFYKEMPSRYSSGALATRETYNERFGSRLWTERLQEVLPFWDFLDVNWRHSMEEPVQILRRDEEPDCLVFTVPKTMKTPRIIAMEPAHNNLVQQGILTIINEVMELPRFSTLRSVMYWDDQTRNQELAREGSLAGSDLCTIDLSEASDRVSLSVVLDGLLGSHGYLRALAKASRSENAKLPDGRFVSLKKFASMGSALTFPFETMVFTAICYQAMKSAGPVGSINDLVGRFSVYGDDIVVPTGYMSHVIEELEAYGLKVNYTKSFGNGFFRESCGADWYNGFRVNPVRVRANLPDDGRHEPESIVRGIDLHNRLYEAGFYKSAAMAREIILSYQWVPFSPMFSVGVAFWTWDRSLVTWKFDKNLHVHSYRSLLQKQKKPLDPLQGWGALRKYFLMRGEFPLEEGHLDRDGRSRCVKLNIGWTAQG